MGKLGILCALTALAVASCHPTDVPPVPPPKPTDPATLAERSPAGQVIDASIVSEGGGDWDSSFQLDTGAIERTACVAK
jgi:hypothetical protein